MAEFKLGRIKFVWKDAWTPATQYYVDDVVRYGAKTYICVAGHTANTDFNVDLNIVPSKWNQMSDGQDWKGDWTTNTFYKLNDVVRYGGALYINNTAHTSAATSELGLEADSAKWALFASGQEWKGEWATATRYKKYDLVKYGGKTYICNTSHTSAATSALGLEANQSNWDDFNQGTEFKGTWTTGTRYKVNDLVKNGSVTWICTTYHTAGATFVDDAANWAEYVKGFEYEAAWSNSTGYQTGDVVSYGGNQYIAKQPNINQNPATSTSNWDLFSEGIKYQSNFNFGQSYKVGELVSLNGNIYLAAQDVPAISGTATTTSSADNTINIGSTAGISVGMAVRFSGTVFGGVISNATYYVADVTSPSTIKISLVSNGSVFTLSSDTGSMAVTVVAMPPNVTYWTRLSGGIYWRNTWAADTEYVVGDAVRYGSNAYICINAHTSQGTGGSLNSRPDLDVTGTFWNSLAVGDANAVLTTRGDMVYYGGAGPTRLPVGVEGQILRVGPNSDPEWVTLGATENVFYVSNSGTDGPAPIHGLSIDKPWKTVRYACEQVEKGPNNPEARYLLERNREFIQKEIIAWINIQIAGNNAPFTTGFTYDSAKCERDMGYIIDALAYDLGHGGNVRSRAAALEYVNNAPAVYSLGQKEETVAAINFGLTVIDAVLSNATPSIVYQSTVTQVKDVSKIEEAGAQTAINSLVKIITDAITAGVATNIPAEVNPFNTIYVKTGVFNEVLPIIVPANTAIVGDELRSTNIRPAGSIVAASDVPYSIAALTHLASIIDEVVQNTAITKSTGNLLNQVTSRPAGSVAAATSAAQILTDAKNYIDFHINGTGSAPALTGSAIPTSTQAYYNAINVIEANREFLVEEAIAYIDVTYPAHVNSYVKASCRRDVRAFIDALKYDLVYTGNYKSLLAARYYRRAVSGSTTEDMFYVRNSTGLRNFTVQGLSGTLGAPNSYGTRRPTAGAFVSLDPGWGPNDNRTWITTRSPYVQNVTTIGTGCVGLKVDGSLHAGGNDSIVANDFTQILNDGIGAWVTNLGRAELVSVFSYYGHIGYLAEHGGKIRATNGNSSYGDFGCVSEGFDVTETPNTAVIDNRQFKATVGAVVTDRAQEILNFEFDNAGSEYTEAEWTVAGAGVFASVEADEFRDGAVFQVHLPDLFNEDSTLNPEAAGNYGGFGYLTNSNTAQGGTTTQITLAATDEELSTAYIGMKVVITGGRGAGQYGIIATYDAGTKVATVNKESTGTAGWDHVVPGTTIVSLDSSSTYTIEPAVSIAAPAFSSAARTLSAEADWVDVEFAGTIKTYLDVTGTASASGINASFDVTRKGTKYTATIKTSGSGYTRLETVTISGTSLDGAAPANNLVITVLSVDGTGAIQAIEVSGVGAGGNFVAIATGATTTSISTNGTTWSAGGTLPAATTWTSMAAGKLTALETAGTFTVGRSYTIVELGNTNWTAIGASANIVGTTFVATGAGGGTGTASPNASHIVAIASGGTQSAYSINGGATWIGGGALPATATWTSVAYGNGRWVAIASGGTATAYSTNGGVTWVAGGPLPASTTWTSIAYGKGVWVAIASGGTQAASSVNGGVTWVSRTLPSSTNWSSVAYGNNRFVAVSSSTGTASAYSLNGTTWVASTVPSAAYTKVSYGQGVFLAVRGTTTAISSEDGIVWTSRTLGASTEAAAFGNPSSSGIWVGYNTGTTNAAMSAILGSRARARAYVADQKIYAIRLLEPGSGYASAPTLTITDPNNVYDVPTVVRIGNGALANPSFVNRGTGYVAANAEILSGNGYADFFQSGSYIAVKRLTARPVPGSNVVFGNLPTRTFKLVNVLSFLGSVDGSYTAFFQVSPELPKYDSPNHQESVTTRIRYSQVRLTGHDFLDIGTGNATTTNYPNVPLTAPDPAKETVENNGGRVFFTSTDQDGNFRVGDLFTIEQSTGIATLNADAFNIAGLQELTLGEVTLGGSSATITEFSTDPFLTANSDNVVPTQRAIKAYISAQIGGGGASLNVNSVTAGSIYIATNQITTTTGETITMKAKTNFKAGVRGLPVAWNYYFN